MTKASPAGSVRWIHEERTDDAVTFRAGKRGSEMVADWPGFARLTCARDGTATHFAPAAGASRRKIGKLRRGQVRALLRDLSGGLALHASAVAIDGRGVLFLGSDGAGKSTAAAELCLRFGAQMFADDAASLEVGAAGVFVLPGEAEHWLTRESCAVLGIPSRRGGATGDDKRNVRASIVSLEPCPLSLVVALRFDPSITAGALRPLRGSEAARWLLDAAVRFDVEDAAARRRELEQLTAVYRHAPIFELVRGTGAPGDVATFVLGELAGRKP